MPPEGADPLATYLDAAAAFADLVDALPADLSGPGLGTWDLRALVGHTARALVTVSDYLRRPAQVVDLASAADYLALVPDLAAGPDVAQRGVAAGAALGADPTAAVRRLLDAVRTDLATADPDTPVTTIGGGIRLRDYLPTRTFELVVHGLDVALVVPVRWSPPPAAVAASVALAAEVACRRGEGPLLLRLLTGREPGGLSIL